MANVIIREDQGKLTFYLAKKDLEDEIVALQHDSEDKWGGEVTLGDGSRYYVDPLPGKPRLPKTVRARRVED